MMNKDYYKNVEIMNNILNSMRFRNNAFLNVTNTFKYNVQNIVVSNTSNLLKNMSRYYFFEREYNIYSSVARFDYKAFYDMYKFPPFSFDLKKRNEQGEIFNKVHKDYIIAYDWVMDFDSKDSFETTYGEVSLLKNQLDIYSVPYIIRFSGRGFHIVIPHKFLPEWFDKSDVNTYKNASTTLKKIYDLSSLDLAIYDSRRVIKTAYSIDNRSGYVCLPLTDLEFKHFSKEYCKPSNVLNMPDLFYRNAVLRPGDSKGVEKFLTERVGING